MSTQTVEYVIVGAGAAGCVIANRLVNGSQDRVFLLEAGVDDGADAISNTDMGSMISLWGSEFDWKYAAEPSPGVNGRAIDIAQGKVSGGGSSINAMMYIRGSRKDFDKWASLGNEGWDYESVLPFFKKSEKYEHGASQYHGSDGSLSVIDYRNPSPVSKAFVEAARELNYKGDNFDCNAEVHENGAFFYQSTRTPENKRCSSSVAFLNSIKSNPRFTLKNSAVVTKVIIENNRAIGVTYLENGEQKTVLAEKEVILCAGAFATPKILMLSGVGPSDELAKHGIELIHELPGVGKNLQDHLVLGVAYKSKVELPMPELLSEAGLFTYTKDLPATDSPDLQFFFGPVQFVAPQYRVDSPSFTLAPILAQPVSRGSVTLRSADPLDNSIVQQNYLSADEDVAVLVAGIKLARELASTSAMASFKGDEIAPGEQVNTPDELAEYVRNVSSTVWHPVGTCKMGTDEMAVVNSELKVNGLAGLRIADASVMPTITSGNTNAATIMIGEKMAHLILN